MTINTETVGIGNLPFIKDGKPLNFCFYIIMIKLRLRYDANKLMLPSKQEPHIPNLISLYVKSQLHTSVS